ncbi:MULTISPECIES: flagellar hook-basal body complex protein FliE [Thermotoga]|jgi:flagellar hook-basal body complex protein FliE|uniref:Flagellar hook-basal body complex protein FliE n=1 Tax=Thermotoga neapolitana (strain ATCC 49049 / DSM 4359 / NBRC 107923 / NS-E) TaxID=309803 RepID=B9K8W8_THENN|nr:MULTISPECIES: flagellar hook-basal body complex protein FliE [Thermotoga]MDK2785879.1 flagellar hook-basal body complex protein FliE [Thermotoga sp.]HBF11254.1 flagellar hook-basal body complex protein FliE [Thermotoga neapolitana]ACM23401.1 Flagellar hook-basal body complex protein fliE [Thermotoga neapolitana DSM 4359]AJG41311.1 flagellar hook-basal body protein FliE [Thermotoga sp. RQ7]KFZ21532.1 flagellar hook-basal body complex subunit FliE [Thermotoga neapolitana LA10]
MVDRIEGLGPIEDTGKVQKKSGGDFSKALKEALEKVNDIQKRAEKMTDDFAQGKISNIHEVIIEAEKASIALRLTVEVRNRIVEAYREIMRMQI